MALIRLVEGPLPRLFLTTFDICDACSGCPTCALLLLVQTYPPIPSSVLHVCYTHDKTIIVVGSNGVIYVFDDRQTDVQVDSPSCSAV